MKEDIEIYNNEKIIFDKNYKKYLGIQCKCGYFYVKLYKDKNDLNNDHIK